MDTGITTILKCQGWCHEPAEVIFNYNISEGRQRVALCSNCAGIWWNGEGKSKPAFRNTGAGLSLTIEAIGC